MQGQVTTPEFDPRPRGVSWLDPAGFACVRYSGPILQNLIARVDGDGSGSTTLWVLPDSTILHREIVA
jgi:hypothetical protein